MNPEIKKQWVAALRSGEYEQGRGLLRSENRFCCLGVLCDLHAKAIGGVWLGIHYLGECYTLPEQVTEWAELKHKSPRVTTATGGKELTAYNDGVCEPDDEKRVLVSSETFAQIADRIEKEEQL